MILVRRGFGGMLSHLSSSESAPPLYYVLAWAWTKLFGTGPLGFRTLSALAGTLTVPVLYFAGRRISTRAGLWAAALACVSPAMLYYSQEARAYALLILFAAAAFVLWQRAWEEPSAGRLAAWSGISILAVLTHYFAAFLFIPEALLLARRLPWRRMLAPAGAVVLVGVALAPLAAAQRADGKTNWIESASLASRIAESAKQFLVGLYGPLQLPAAALSGGLALGALALLVARGEALERSRARVVALVAAVAVALPLVVAVAHVLDVFDGRNIIAAWAPCAVLIAAGLGIARAGRSGALLGAGLLVISLAVNVATLALPAYQRDDWRGVARALPPVRTQRVIVGPENTELPLSIYLPRLRAMQGAIVTTAELDFVALRKRRTVQAPRAPVVPELAPPGFRLVSVRRSAAFAVARFTAPRPLRVRVALLRRLARDSNAEAIGQTPVQRAR